MSRWVEKLIDDHVVLWRTYVPEKCTTPIYQQLISTRLILQHGEQLWARRQCDTPSFTCILDYKWYNIELLQLNSYKSLSKLKPKLVLTPRSASGWLLYLDRYDAPPPLPTLFALFTAAFCQINSRVQMSTVLLTLTLIIMWTLLSSVCRHSTAPIMTYSIPIQFLGVHMLWCECTHGRRFATNEKLHIRWLNLNNNIQYHSLQTKQMDLPNIAHVGICNSGADDEAGARVQDIMTSGDRRS